MNDQPTPQDSLQADASLDEQGNEERLNDPATNAMVHHDSDTVSDPAPPNPTVEVDEGTDTEGVKEQKPGQDFAITKDQLDDLKNEVVENAKRYAKAGSKTRKEPSPSLANDLGPYNWYERQDSYEGNTWSISFWDYDNKTWHIQASKIELLQDGKSLMTAYSLRDDHDASFPGFQVYKEQSDTRYHMAAIEDVVYLDRVLKELVKLTEQNNT